MVAARPSASPARQKPSASVDLKAFGDKLAKSGFDVIQPFDVRWYNNYVKAEGLPLKPLPTFGLKSGAVGILIGNSRAIWPAFLSWLGQQQDPLNMSDPLDTFIATIIKPAVATLAGKDVKYDVIWPWEGGSRLCSMQRVAICSALCYHDSETQLAIHPRFGSWVAFRAVVVLHAEPSAHGLAGTAPKPLSCLMSEAEKSAARAAMQAALRASDEANLCTQLHGAKGMERDVRLAWAALRDCVRVGSQHRYTDEQLTYHYTKDKAVLEKALRAHGARRWRVALSWLVSLAEVVLTFALPLLVIVLAVWTSGKRGLPGKPGQDSLIHPLAR